MRPTYDYIAVGHVTRDIIEDRLEGATSQPGGGAFYSALQAARLGLRTLIVTQGVLEEIEALIAPYRDELDVRVIPAEHTTTLSTRGAGSSRSQRLLSWAGPISSSVELDASIVHFAPVAREGRAGWSGDAGLIGVTPQGFIRRWDEHGDISPVGLDPCLLPDRCHAAVINESERDFCQPLLARAAEPDGPLVAVTAGAQPTALHLPGGAVVHTEARESQTPLDDLGAGDVFAAALFVELASGHAPLIAATFANRAAAVRIAGAGPNAIGRRADITP